MQIQFRKEENQQNKTKQNSLHLFDTCFWMSAQSQPRLTSLNLSADSGSKEQGLPASQWKNTSIEIKSDWGGNKEEEKKAVTW